MINRNKIVFLTGGLGNQLFQLAHGLSKVTTNELDFEIRLGKPRGINEPDLFDFDVVSEVSKTIYDKDNWFISKCLSYILHLGVNPDIFEKSRYFQKFIETAVGFFCSVFFKRRIKIQCFHGAGYEREPSRSRSTNLLIGYFQTFRWAATESTHKKLMLMAPRFPSEELDALKEEAKAVIPLVVHVRLTDYKSESSFGIPSRNYYKTAIDALWKSGQYGEIWIFTDEPDLVLSYLPESLPGKFRILGEISNSPAMTLEAMRYGHGYVLANSSFSWWGAYLSYTQDAQVIAPFPWFLNREEPVDICLPNWQRNNAFSETYE